MTDDTFRQQMKEHNPHLSDEAIEAHVTLVRSLEIILKNEGLPGAEHAVGALGAGLQLRRMLEAALSDFEGSGEPN